MTLTPRQLHALRRLQIRAMWHGVRGEMAKEALREFYRQNPTAPVKCRADFIDDKSISSGTDDPDQRWRLDADGGAKW